MRKPSLILALLLIYSSASAQTDPNITHWLINTTNILGSHYVQGNSTPIQDNVQANVQQVQYSDDWVYVHTNGIPAYISGPFLDGNPSIAQSQDAIFRFPRNPVENTGAPTATNMGDIGNFINGVGLFDNRDGASWKSSTNAMAGGPFGGMGDNVWRRDAVVGERMGFDCAKGHPAMGNYHHHQNPSAFNLDLVVISNVCDLYLADGLYTIDSTEHSPLLGFAYDGFPIYGAYGYANADGTGGLIRMHSGYQLRSITQRTTYADGSDVIDGPGVNATYPLGYFGEDYEFIEHPGEAWYLDRHNGRFCVTPEYPSGTYAYFCTVDEHWNSAFPYAVGPTYYGVKTAGSVTSITESVVTYDPGTGVAEVSPSSGVGVYPNPSGDLIAVQISGLQREDVAVRLFDAQGKLVRSAVIPQGSTIWYLDTRTLYDGRYTVEVTSGNERQRSPVIVAH